jgi:hypothetical protein
MGGQSAKPRRTAVDAAGAERLRLRIEQQQHWRQAASVLDGRQPPTDPDQEQLQTFDEGIRFYAPRVTQKGIVRMCKRLVDGTWENGMLDEGFTAEPASAGAMAHVA